MYLWRRKPKTISVITKSLKKTVVLRKLFSSSTSIFVSIRSAVFESYVRIPFSRI